MMAASRCGVWMKCHAAAVERRERRRRLWQGVIVLAVFLSLGVVL